MSRMILPEHIFAVVTGLTDGILTALTLGAGRIVASTEPITIGLAFRISIASSLSGVFVFFTADYIRQRRQLVYFERQLSLMSKNHLAATRLGQAARSDSMRAAAISSICNLLGALLPLITGALLPRFSWLAIAIALLALSVLGVTAARSLYGNPILWAAALVVAGSLLTITGIELRIV